MASFEVDLIFFVIWCIETKMVLLIIKLEKLHPIEWDTLGTKFPKAHVYHI